MRLRTIKPGFFANDTLAEMSPLTRLLFAGLWCYADREGRFEWRPRRIKAALLPYDDCGVGKMLDELAEWGFIQSYVVDGERFGAIAKFDQHQNPHVKERPSTIPAPDKHSSCTPKGSDEPGGEWVVGSGDLSLGSETPPKSAGASPAENGKAKKQPYEPTHEKTRDLCGYLGRALKHWKPDVRAQTESTRSLREMDLMLRKDRRDVRRVKAVLDWLFLGEGGCYSPEGEFDWRPNVNSGATLRKHFDKLESAFLRDAGLDE